MGVRVLPARSVKEAGVVMGAIGCRISLLCALGLLVSCSGGSDDGAGRSGGASGTGDTAGGDGFGNSNNIGGPGGGIAGTSGAVGDLGSGTGTVIEGCGGMAYEAEAKQLDIYTLYDDSGSMIPWWVSVADAFVQFMSDPRSEGIAVGLKFFGSECGPAFYSTPDVPIAPVATNAAVISQTLMARAPFSGTATTPALEGGLMGAQAHAMANPESKVVIMLVTDGQPSNCNSTLDSASAAAMNGFANMGIPTYVLGLGDIAGLNAMAVAGGTGAALSADPNNVNALVEKMNEIRGQALPCDYALPDGTEDPGLVNVQFSVGDNPTTVPGVADATACDPTAGGWYYDDPTAPTRILACDQTCGKFKAALDGQVNVVLGCPTMGPS